MTDFQTFETADGFTVQFADGSTLNDRSGNVRTFRAKKTANRAAREALKAAQETPTTETTPDPKPTDEARGGSLSERAMLVGIKVRMWGASKRDDAVSIEITKSKNAAEQSGRFTKKLVFSDTLNQIRSVGVQARNFHTTVTLPWSKSTRIIRVDRFAEFAERMGQYETEFNALVEQFAGEYEAAVSEAADALGDLYSAEDYPSADEITAKFAFQWDVMPVPETDDFRANVSEAQAEQIRSRIERDLKTREKEATQDGLAQIGTALRDFVTKLTAEVSGRGSSNASVQMQNKLMSLFDRIEGADISEGLTLAEFAEQARGAVDMFAPAELRENEDAREKAAKAANDILAKMDAWA